MLCNKKIVIAILVALLPTFFTSDALARRRGGGYSKRSYSSGYSLGSGYSSRSLYTGGSSSSSSGYYTGPRGGCYTYSASGRKEYVDHSYCNGGSSYSAPVPSSTTNTLAAPVIPSVTSLAPKTNTPVYRQDWGNDIQAVLTQSTCQDAEFLTQGYQYAVDSSIPLYKMKRPTDAYYKHEGRGYTVRGCWFKKEDGLLHTKMRRKHDNKVWEMDLNLNDGRWVSSP